MPLARPSTSRTPPNKQLPTIKQCPRANATQGKNDWLTVTSPRTIPDFDICPDCYNNSIRNTYYDAFISASPSKHKNTSTICDFSQRWMKLAYLWLFYTGQPNLNLLAEVSSIQRDAEGICPNMDVSNEVVKRGGKPTATRTWYCLEDPNTGAFVEELTGCSDCVAHINLLYPCLRGIFKQVANGRRLPATCDLTLIMGSGQERSLELNNEISTLAETTLDTRTRDTTPLIAYIRKWASIPLCPREKPASGPSKYYSLSHLGNDFAACEECFTKHIGPLPITATNRPILSNLVCNDAPTGGYTCDMYSPRLRGYFTTYLATSDTSTFRTQLTTRFAKQNEYNMQLTRMQQQFQSLKLQAQNHNNQGLIAHMQAKTQNGLWATSAWRAPPIDWSRANGEMAASTAKELEAAAVLDGMVALEREWAQYWE